MPTDLVGRIYHWHRRHIQLAPHHDRLDNTIRYSSAEVRDRQRAAAVLFRDLILYDAHYYKSTDAHAVYDAFGDVIGGSGRTRFSPTRITTRSTTCRRRSISGWWRRWRRRRWAW